MCYHYFHLTLDQKTIDLLIKIRGLSGNKKFSILLKEIVEAFYYKIEKKHFLRKILGNGYELVNPDTNVGRKDVWFSIKKDIYKRLVQIRADLYFFSVAKIIRKAIRWYLDMMDGQSHEEVLLLCEAEQKRWEEDKKSYTVDPIDLIQHKLKLTTPTNGKSKRYIVIYSKRATPKAIYSY